MIFRRTYKGAPMDRNEAELIILRTSVDGAKRPTKAEVKEAQRVLADEDEPPAALT